MSSIYHKCIDCGEGQYQKPVQQCGKCKFYKQSGNSFPGGVNEAVKYAKNLRLCEICGEFCVAQTDSRWCPDCQQKNNNGYLSDEGFMEVNLDFQKFQQAAREQKLRLNKDVPGPAAPKKNNMSQARTARGPLAVTGNQTERVFNARGASHNNGGTVHTVWYRFKFTPITATGGLGKPTLTDKHMLHPPTTYLMSKLLEEMVETLDASFSTELAFNLDFKGVKCQRILSLLLDTKEGSFVIPPKPMSSTIAACLVWAQGASSKSKRPDPLELILDVKADRSSQMVSRVLTEDDLLDDDDSVIALSDTETDCKPFAQFPPPPRSANHPATAGASTKSSSKSSRGPPTAALFRKPASSIKASNPVPGLFQSFLPRPILKEPTPPPPPPHFTEDKTFARVYHVVCALDQNLQGQPSLRFELEERKGFLWCDDKEFAQGEAKRCFKSMYIRGSEVPDRTFEDYHEPELHFYGTLPNNYHVVKQLRFNTLLKSGTMSYNSMENINNEAVLGRFLGTTGMELLYLQAEIAGHLWGNLFCSNWRKQYQTFDMNTRKLCIDLSFVKCDILVRHLPDDRPDIINPLEDAPVWMIEKWRDEKTERFSGSLDFQAGPSKVAQNIAAFTHFAYESSYRTRLLSDLEAWLVGTKKVVLYDPMMHIASNVLEQPGVGNQFEKAVAAFKAQHKCNDICIAFHLPPPGLDMPLLDQFDEDSRQRQKKARAWADSDESLTECESPAKSDVQEMEASAATKGGSKKKNKGRLNKRPRVALPSGMATRRTTAREVIPAIDDMGPVDTGRFSTAGRPLKTTSKAAVTPVAPDH